jgi:hypothetical protein
MVERPRAAPRALGPPAGSPHGRNAGAPFAQSPRESRKAGARIAQAAAAGPLAR